ARPPLEHARIARVAPAELAIGLERLEVATTDEALGREQCFLVGTRAGRGSGTALRSGGARGGLRRRRRAGAGAAGGGNAGGGRGGGRCPASDDGSRFAGGAFPGGSFAGGAFP